MGVVVAIFSLLHFFVFLAVLLIFIKLYKKKKYSRYELQLFVISSIVVSIISFFLANHMAIFVNDGSVLTAIGYSTVPIVQVSIALFSYSYIHLYANQKIRESSYPPLFLGIVLSAPISLALTAAFSEYYWTLLGKSIYG